MGSGGLEKRDGFGSGSGMGKGGGGGSRTRVRIWVGEGEGAWGGCFPGAWLLLVREVARNYINVHVRDGAKTIDFFPRGPFFRRFAGPWRLGDGVSLWAFAFGVAKDGTLSL